MAIKKEALLIVFALILITSATASPTVLSPLNETYYMDNGSKRMRLYIDYLNDACANDTFLAIDNNYVSVRKDDLVGIYSSKTPILLEDNSQKIEFPSAVRNYIEYSLAVSVSGKGRVNITLDSGSEHIMLLGYSREKIWYCMNGISQSNIMSGEEEKTYEYLTYIS